MSYAIHVGDNLGILRSMPANLARTCVTSPPYYGLRDYQTATWEGGDDACQHVTGNQVDMTKDAGTSREGVYSSGVRPGSDNSRCRKCGATRIDSQIGLEPTAGAYVANLVEIFREVRRVLTHDGTLWLNLGSSYNGSGGAGGDYGVGGLKEGQPKYPGRNLANFKPKDMIPIPWMVAMALQEDGWYLRADIIWHKPNAMVESVKDRPTRAHEYIFLLSKNKRYFYDHKAVREEAKWERWGKQTVHKPYRGIAPVDMQTLDDRRAQGRNRRSVWSVNTRPYKGAHFATFPVDLIEPCVLAGSEQGDVVLDPFSGAGTTGIAALKHGRHFHGIELNPDYATMAAQRIESAIMSGQFK